MDDIGLILAAGFRLAIPLVFAASGEYVAERAGTLNVSVEGMMLAGAYTGATTSMVTGSWVAGLLAGILGGGMVGLAQANLTHRLGVNTFVVALALNTLVIGLTSFLHEEFSTGKRVPSVPVLELPFLSDLPLIGDAVFGQRWPAYLVLLLLPGIWFLVNRTRWGLQVRAVGENPQAADVSGVPVLARRRQAVLLAGLCSGLGGAHLAVVEVSGFNNNMSAGRGFLAIAAVIFGGWKLFGAVAGCLLFGIADALRLSLPAVGIELTPQLLIIAPYVAALVTMLVLARRQTQPGALAATFERGLT